MKTRGAGRIFLFGLRMLLFRPYEFRLTMTHDMNATYFFLHPMKFTLPFPFQNKK